MPNVPLVWLTWGLFLATYVGLAIGRLPGLRIDRAGIAFLGATLVLICGVLPVDEAFSPASVDYRTLLLLLGMMIVVGALRLAGFFQRLTSAALQRITTSRQLLAATIALSGIMSAFLINDVVCVALTPLVLRLSRRMGVDPTPHLIGLATAANIGSTATITGNPQNILIGVQSGISYLRFAERLAPIAAIGLVLNYWVIRLICRGQLSGGAAPAQANGAGGEDRSPNSRAHRRLLIKCTAVALIAIVLFFVGLPLELVALGAAGVVLLSRVRPQRFYHEVDWSLLVMFTGLFIVVHAFQRHVVSRWGIENWTWLLEHPTGVLSGVSAALSNVVSNVPAVLLLEPVAKAAAPGAQESAWLALAMSSTLAGNLTILGSVANLIVVERARREQANITFWQYARVGVPLTLLTLLVGVAWLQWVRY